MKAPGGLKRLFGVLLAAALACACAAPALAAAGNCGYVLPAEYDGAEIAGPENRIIARKDGKYALYDADGALLSADYDVISENRGGAAGYFTAEDGGDRVVLRADGTEAYRTSGPLWVGSDCFVTPVYPEGYDASGDGRCLFGYKVRSMDGAEISEVPAFYHDTFAGEEVYYGSGVFAYEDESGVWRARDEKGNIVIDADAGFSYVYGFENGSAAAARGGEFGYDGERFRVVGGRYGIIDTAGKTLADFGYDNIARVGDAADPAGGKSVYITEKDGKWGIIDGGTLKTLCAPVFSGFRPGSAYVGEGAATVWKYADGGGTLSGAVDMDGAVILPCVYADVGAPSEGIIAAKNAAGRWAYFDYSGAQLTDFAYDRAGSFHEGLAWVDAGTWCGYIDKTGKAAFVQSAALTEPYGDNVFSGGLAPAACAGGGLCYADATGRARIESPDGAAWSRVLPFENGLAAVTGAADAAGACKWGVVRAEGGVPSPWAAEDAAAAVKAGIVPEELQSWYGSGATRLEFCRLAVKMLEKKGVALKAPAESPFTDTSDAAVLSLASAGVVDGCGGGVFAPDGLITREQAAKILVKTAAFMGAEKGGAAAEYADDADISDWAKEYVSDAAAYGVMNGTGGGSFTPAGPYTIEQSIVTALRLFKK